MISTSNKLYWLEKKQQKQLQQQKQQQQQHIQKKIEPSNKKKYFGSTREGKKTREKELL